MKKRRYKHAKKSEFKDFNVLIVSIAAFIGAFLLINLLFLIK